MIKKLTIKNLMMVHPLTVFLFLLCWASMVNAEVVKWDFKDCQSVGSSNNEWKIFKDPEAIPESALFTVINYGTDDGRALAFAPYDMRQYFDFAQEKPFFEEKGRIVWKDRVVGAGVWTEQGGHKANGHETYQVFYEEIQNGPPNKNGRTSDFPSNHPGLDLKVTTVQVTEGKPGSKYGRYFGITMFYSNGNFSEWSVWKNFHMKGGWGYRLNQVCGQKKLTPMVHPEGVKELSELKQLAWYISVVEK